MKRYKSLSLLALCVLLGAFLIPRAMDAVGSSSPLLFAALCLAAGCFLHETQEAIGNMLEDVYRILEVRNDERFLIKDCEWTMLSTERGDRLLIVRNAEENTVMLAEELR